MKQELEKIKTWIEKRINFAKKQISKSDNALQKASEGGKIRAFKECLNVINTSLASTPKVNLVEVEKLVQRQAQEYASDEEMRRPEGMNEGEWLAAKNNFIKELRTKIGYDLSDLTSEKEEGR